METKGVWFLNILRNWMDRGKQKDSWSPDRDSNPGYPKHEAEVPTTQSRRSVLEIQETSHLPSQGTNHHAADRDTCTATQRSAVNTTVSDSMRIN